MIKIKLGVPQIFGGRKAIVPIKYNVSAESRRIVIEGFYRDDYKQYLKFVTFDPKTGQTIAEKEGIKMPLPTIIQINHNTTIREVKL